MGFEDLRGFRTLKAEERKRIAAATRRVDVAVGQVIFSIGQEADSIWAVHEGLVRLVKHGPGGRDVVVEIVTAGEMFGAVVALGNKPYPVTAVAAAPSVLLRLPAALARELCQKHPTLRAAILEQVTSRLQVALDRVSSFALERVDQRLARQLLSLLPRIGRHEGDAILVHITRQELAEMVGTTVETTIRITSHWQHLGVIRSARHEIAVIDETRLASLACGQPCPDLPCKL